MLANIKNIRICLDETETYQKVNVTDLLNLAYHVWLATALPQLTQCHVPYELQGSAITSWIITATPQMASPP